MTHSIFGSITAIREKIDYIARGQERQIADVTLLVVTKTVPADRVVDALSCGIRDIAESRIQEAGPKFAQLGERLQGVRKHLIGHLQTNKAGRAVELFDLIQSLDSSRLAIEIDRQAAKRGKVQDCLLEIKVSPEESKCGAAPEDAVTLLQECRALKNIRLCGMMAMAPYFEDREQSRPYFRRARVVYEEIKAAGGPEFNCLSMGMSHDFEIALQEGATMVRIGSMIFTPAKG